MFAEVILPLKLAAYYTYTIPDTWREKVAVGKRVLVPFGKSKYYAGIIARIHTEKPNLGLIKSIEEVLDEQPILSQIQLEFWAWLASYYMCTIGEVMETALPNYFKLSSERFFKLSEDTLGNEQIESLIENGSEEDMLLEAIRSSGQLSFKEIKENFGNKKGLHSLNKLIDCGLIEPIDIVKDKYKARYEKFIRLHYDYTDTFKINEAFNLLQSKSPQQYKVLMTYFSLTKNYDGVLKSDLLHKADSNAAVLKSIIDKGILVEFSQQVDRFSIQKNVEIRKAVLCSDQELAYNSITNQLQEKKVVLLRGITGSGKTEVYIKLIQEHKAQGKTCLLVLPEIALTQQIVSRLNHYFGTDFLVYHSLISQNKRYEIWKKVQAGEISFIIGTRSALFLPFQNLDLAIIDEEHDSSLKQTDSNPKFHLRDSIIHYAQTLGTKILLGSATPSVETYFNVLQGKYGYTELLTRYGAAQIPEIELINLREHEVAQGMKSFYSEQLLNAVTKTVANGQQAILFQNRRGYSPYIQCNTCGFVQKCDHCDVRLTYHSYHKLLVCHYCNKKYSLKPTCLDCGSSELKTKGLGTQKVEEEINLFLPNMKLGRLDLDAAGSIAKIDHILNQFKNKDFDVLIGTQMVSKGLDFENLTLVGVVQADIFFSFIEYKTDEKAFQTLHQVSGRVGRGLQPGKVLIQTSDPQNKVIQFVLNNDWKGFVEQELKMREKFIYPPYCKLLKISIKHIKEDLVKIYADKIVLKLNQTIKGIVLGPNIPPVSRIRNQFIREILIKLPKNKYLAGEKQKIQDVIASELMTLDNRNFSIDIFVDV
ncbi:MAG: primosomal protein N' [Chitinophagales bacterium]|nr:primosomal protein N' [Sphingobacteriales bacterium]